MLQSSPLSYSSRPTRHQTRCIVLAIILAALYSPSYAPHPTRYRPSRRHPHWHRILVTLYCTTSRYVCHSESYANHVTKLATVILVASYSPSYSPHCTRHHTRRIVLAIIRAAS